MAIRNYIENEKKLYEVYINGFNSRGSRVQRKRRGIETLRKAEQIEFELKRELAKLKEQKVDPRWEEWCEECFNQMKLTYRPSTLYSYQKTVGKWINKHWNGKELKAFTKNDVYELLYEKITSDVGTDFTRKYVLKIIKRIFQMAIDQGYLDRNPAQGLMIKVPENEKKVLTNTEAEIFLSEAKNTNHRFYPVWLLALFTGARSGELFALKWLDVDFESALISINKSWNSKNGFTSTKNQKTRLVPISEDLLNYLKELKLSRGTEEFVLPRLNEWERGEAAKVTRKFCKAIGVTDIRFHDLRATFITNLLARGESLVRVMAIVGHSDMETTNVYLRKAGIELKNGTEKLGYKIPKDQTAQVFNLNQAKKTL